MFNLFKSNKGNEDTTIRRMVNIILKTKNGSSVLDTVPVAEAQKALSKYAAAMRRRNESGRLYTETVIPV